jgi:hypothetical protein
MDAQIALFLTQDGLITGAVYARWQSPSSWCSRDAGYLRPQGEFVASQRSPGSAANRQPGTLWLVLVLTAVALAMEIWDAPVSATIEELFTRPAVMDCFRQSRGCRIWLAARPLPLALSHPDFAPWCHWSCCTGSRTDPSPRPRCWSHSSSRSRAPRADECRTHPVRCRGSRTPPFSEARWQWDASGDGAVALCGGCQRLVHYALFWFFNRTFSKALGRRQ